MTTHSRILAWKTPWTEEPCGLQSMGLQSQTRLNIGSTTITTKTSCSQINNFFFLKAGHDSWVEGGWWRGGMGRRKPQRDRV